jgi:hypothetical protein
MGKRKSPPPPLLCFPWESALPYWRTIKITVGLGCVCMWGVCCVGRYVPCDLWEWSRNTSELDGLQVQKVYTPSPYNPSRYVSGFYDWGLPSVGQCFAFEIPSLTDSPRPSWFR